MNQCECELFGHLYTLDLEPPKFGLEFDRGPKGEVVLILSWCYRTQFRNIVLLKLVTIRLKPPFMRICEAVLDTDEPIEEGEK
ncbi:hypothetical protein LCGC14_0732790 [marine sediment metagenome]|uniref:Uncharacterized protein n=1 Tax=marine sediment metagenome TaxID=412755 RepID=A0A0F9Q928_9ZZZZ